jgi:hypothetical protein
VSKKAWLHLLYSDSEVVHAIWWQKYLGRECIFLLSIREAWYALSVSRYVHLFVISLFWTAKNQNGQIRAEDPNQIFSMKGCDSRLIHRELKSILHDSAYSLSTVERCSSRFKTGVVTCEDNPKPGRSPSDLGSSLAAFLLEFPFASACQMSKHFRASYYTIKDILGRQLGLRKFSRRRFPCRVSDDQKITRARDVRALLAIWLRLQDNFFEWISTGMSRGSYMNKSLNRCLQLPEKQSRQDVNTKFRPRRQWSLFSWDQRGYWFSVLCDTARPSPRTLL